MTWHVNKRELYAFFLVLWVAWSVVLAGAYKHYAVTDNAAVLVGLAIIVGFLGGMATVAVAEKARLLRLYSNKGKGRDPRKAAKGGLA